MSNVNKYNKEQCFGCTACYNICPQNCIKMVFDEEGFKYPYVDISLCIDCGLCIKHCPITNDFTSQKIKACFGLIHNSNFITDQSASGGAFTAVAEYVLEKNGIVYGCAFNNDIEAVTIAIDNSKDLNKLRGSKYVQCDNLQKYREIQENLDKDIEVLYASTPCNVSGLKAYLGKLYENLTTLDLFCHGVPSPILFKNYITWLENKYYGKVTEYSFRDKKYGWGTQGHFTINGKHHILYGTDPYYNSFLYGKTYRPSCYQCKFASSKRTGDISIGDFWGIEQFHPEVDTNQGVSAILINTEKGLLLKQAILSKATLIETSFENISFLNKQLVHPVIKPQIRDQIYVKFQEMEFNNYVHAYLFPEPEMIIKMKQLIPARFKAFLRKYLGVIINKIKN